MKIQTFTVKGEGHFPIDMLRYDCCYPDGSEAVDKISSDNLNPRTIELGRRVERKSDVPTSDRWRSFGWEVTSVRTY